MHMALFVLGLLVAAAGFVTIGFGIPNYAFGFGNTLIIAGTVAVACGLILIGIAMAVRQLSRLADALGTRPMPRPSRPAENGDALVPPTARITPAAARPPVPPQPPEATLPRMPEPRPAEPRMPPSVEDKGPLHWLRAKPKSSGEPSMIEVPDEAPLSPRPPRPAMPPRPMAEPMFEPKVWSPSRSNGPAEQRPVPRSEQIPRVTPPGEPPREKLFDVVWPDGRSAPPESE